MAFDGSTFVLEIVNFLVLVWLLKRFLYKPVLDMVERRRQAVDKTLQDAQEAREEARRLQAGYQAREAQWQQELAHRRLALDEQLDVERDKRMKALEAELDAERRRRSSQEAHERATREQALQVRAAGQATRFAAGLLTRLTGPELQSRILQALLEDFARLDDAQCDCLRKAAATAREVVVTSTAELPEVDRQHLRQALAAKLPTLPVLRFEQDPALVAGLRIGVGAWELDASLQGELRAFAEASGHG